MAVSNGDTVRAAAKLRTASGNEIINVFHYQATFATSQSLEDVADAIAVVLDDLYSAIVTLIPTDVTFVDIDVQNVTTGEVGAPVPWPSMTAGSGANDTMPEQCCGLVVGHTNVPHVVGRKFLGPFIEAWNDDGAWSSGALDLIADFAEGLLTQAVVSVGNYLKPGVARYVSGGLVDRFVEFLSASASAGIFTQRRRRRGVGA